MLNSPHISLEIVESCPADPEAVWNVKLDDGSHIVIRQIHSGDAGLEREFIEHLSSETRYHRFLSCMLHPSNELIKNLTDIDHNSDEAYIALVNQNGKPIQIGASRFYSDDDGKSCECAIVVADDWQQRGIGSLLIHRLIETAKSRQIKHMYSIDMAENSDMYEFSDFHGFEHKTNPYDATQVIHTLALH